MDIADQMCALPSLREVPELGASKGDTTWINRVSQAVNTTSSLIKFERGDNIVITDFRYPTGSYPFPPGGSEAWRSGVPSKAREQRHS